MYRENTVCVTNGAMRMKFWHLQENQWTGRHHGKSNKQDTERQILHVFICGGKTVDHREVEIEQSSLEVREGGEE